MGDVTLPDETFPLAEKTQEQGTFQDDNPYYEDFLDRILEIHWPEGTYALVHIQTTANFGFYPNDEPLPFDGDSNLVEFNPELVIHDKKAKQVYDRRFTDTSIFTPVTQYALKYDQQMTTVHNTSGGDVVYDGFFNACPPLNDPSNFTNTFTATSGTYTFFVGLSSPYLDGPFQGPWRATAAAAAGDTGVRAFFSGCYSTPDDVPLIVGNTYHQNEILNQVETSHIITRTENGANFEQIYVINLSNKSASTTEPTFSIKTQGYQCEIMVMLFAKKGIKLDKENSEWGGIFGFNPPNGRTYFPFNWSSKLAGPPKDPTGKKWPGYAVFPTSAIPKTSLANAAMYTADCFFNAASGTQEYKFVVSTNKHLFSDPPKTDKMHKNKILEVYLDESSDGGHSDGVSTFWGYTDVPYGTLYDPRKTTVNEVHQNFQPTRGAPITIDKDVPTTGYPYF